MCQKIKLQIMKVKIFNINYDTDGEEISDITKEFDTTLEEMGWSANENDVSEFMSERGADYISDKTGWCVVGFNYELY